MRTAIVREAQPKAVIVYCIDPRFQEEFRRVIRELLGLGDGEFVPIAVAGGASVLARPDQFENDFFSVGDQIEFALSHFLSIRRVVLVNHQDCGRVKIEREEAEEDLQKAAEAVIRLSHPMPSPPIQLFFSAFDGTHAVPLRELQTA